MSDFYQLPRLVFQSQIADEGATSRKSNLEVHPTTYQEVLSRLQTWEDTPRIYSIGVVWPETWSRKLAPTIAISNHLTTHINPDGVKVDRSKGRLNFSQDEIVSDLFGFVRNVCEAYNSYLDANDVSDVDLRELVRIVF